jgi:signal transduction histidine kinase
MLGVRKLPEGSHLVVWYQTWHLEEGEASQAWRLILGLGIPLGLAALAWVAIAALSNLVFHPLKSLAEAVAQREEGEALFAPLRDRFAADEIGAIAGVFDEYLTRIRAVTERERRFTRDASHELRTPLAVITAALDCLPPDSLSLAQQRSVGRIRRACARMQRLIDAFLLLARNEDASDCTATPAEIVQQLDLPEMAVVEIDPILAEVQVAWADLVVVMLENLVRNAQSHGAGGLSIRWTSGGIQVTNAIDPDRPVPPDLLISGSRGQASDGFGLGLDIVRHLAERMVWKVRVTTSSDRFSVLLCSDVQAEQTS